MINKMINMKKALFRLALGLVGLLTTTTASADSWENHCEALDIEGKGSLVDPIVISTPGQLAELAHIVNGGNSLESKIIVLANDIDLTAYDNGVRRDWKPIGGESKPFRGMFMGINPTQEGWDQQEPYTIKGLYITTSNFMGLFGRNCGLVCYLNITGAEVIIKDRLATVGIVCAQNDNCTNNFIEDYQTNRSFVVQSAVYAVSVEGKVDGSGKWAGGVVGHNSGHVVHTSAKVSLFNGPQGGIVGRMNNGSVFDCAADIDLKGSPSYGAGGIVGYIEDYGSVEACASTGYIGGSFLRGGGIVGRMSANGFVRGCVSTVTFNCTHERDSYLGGIVGEMHSPNSTVEVTGSIESKIESCVFAGIMQGLGEFKAGICGHILWGLSDERIVNSLVVSSHYMEDGFYTIAGRNTDKPVETLSNSYWDKSLYEGTKVCYYTKGSAMDPTTVKGLTTAKLTSGKSSDANLLENNEDADFYFKFQSGYYPRLMVNKEWSGYETMKDNVLDTDAGRRLFGDEVYRGNSVMMPFAWLAAIPVLMPKGDTAYDLCSTVSHKEKTLNWNEDQRNIAVKSVLTFPDANSSISVKDGVATAITDGTFIATMTLEPTKKVTGIFNRPQPFMPTKEIYFNATPDQVWDGTTATEYADGSGLAEDPYIVKTGAQLALAIATSKEGEWFKQICDINLNKPFKDNIPQYDETVQLWGEPVGWKGVYNGDGHYVTRYYNHTNNSSLFGDVANTAQIFNLGMVEAGFNSAASAFLANNVDGKIYNCVVQGVCQPFIPASSVMAGDWQFNGSGGICTSVGKNNAEAVVEDCVSAAVCSNIFEDYNPLVCLADRNKGTVRNCLVTVPTFNADRVFENNGITADGKSYIKDCYWLKGMEDNATGYTLEELQTLLGSRQRWQTTENYYPMLKTFAESDMGKLLMLPVRTDLNFGDDDNDNFQMGFNRHLLFEPGGASWVLDANAVDIVDADGDMGIISPIKSTEHPREYNQYWLRNLPDLGFLTGTIGKFSINMPLRTSDKEIYPGISFVDDHALRACLDAFNTDDDTEHLSLAELKAVTNEQTLNAFQTTTARQIKIFPEFRLFKSVTRLTSQLNNLSELELVRLPYALKTIGSNAFKGCTKLKDITVSSKVTNVDPHPFYGSAIEHVNVDPFNTDYVSRSGVLFDVNNTLVAYPNGRKDNEEIVISGIVSTIEEGAFYRVQGMKRLFFDLDDYRRYIPELWEGGIETTDGNLIDVYVKDGSFDQQVYNEMLDDYSWEEYAQAGRLHRYFPLKVDKDGLGSFYIGFDAELPADLTPYIVARSRADLKTAFLLPVSREVPAESPVVVIAGNPTGEAIGTTYNLLPLSQQLTPWKMYENRLNSVGIDGLPVYQEDSSEGGVYTLQKDADGTVGFFIHREEMVAPYHAFLPYNSIGDQLEQGVYFRLATKTADPNNLTYWACPDGYAILTGYEGQGDEHLVVPERISATLPAATAPASFTVTEIDPAILSDNTASIWSIDFTKNTQIKDIHVDRSDKQSPFYKSDPRTILYLPEDRGFTAAEGEQNVVIGTECRKLALTDGWAFQPPYDFTADHATYDRVFSAVQNNDGAWTPKAFSVCLPYTVVLNKDVLTPYELYWIDNNARQFIFSKVTTNHLMAGHAYVIVVNSGSLLLESDKSDLPEWQQDGLLVMSTPYTERRVWFTDDSQGVDTYEPAGYWQGTFMSMSNSECSEKSLYVMQSDGTCRIVSNKTSAQRKVKMAPFRAFFEPGQALGYSNYVMSLSLIENSAGGEELYVTHFPAGDYESDGDIPPYDDDIVVGILPIVHDAASPLGVEEDASYYDLQGRRLQGKPAKGLYIYKGVKLKK